MNKPQREGEGGTERERKGGTKGERKMSEQATNLIDKTVVLKFAPSSSHYPLPKRLHLLLSEGIYLGTRQDYGFTLALDRIMDLPWHSTGLWL